jgi:hypothetical protein
LYKAASDLLYEIYYKKKLPVFFVNVIYNNPMDVTPHCVYLENGVIKKVQTNGVGEPLKDYLLNLNGIEASE